MKRLHFALFACLAALGIALLLERRPFAPGAATKARAKLAEIALPNAALLVTVDLAALRASPWGKAALSRLTELVLGRAEATSCADRALLGAERFALVVPTDAAAVRSAPELGLIAEGDFRVETVLGCAEELLRARRGDPTRMPIASFATLRDRRGGGELAVRADGPLIVSGGGYFRDLLERAEGSVSTSAGPRETLHLSLRGELGPAPLLATWVLPAGWLERWLEDPELRASPLASVRALGLRGEVGAGLGLRAVLVTADAETGRRISEFLKSVAREFEAELKDALGPRGAQALAIEQKGARIELRLSLSAPLETLGWLGARTAPSAAPSASQETRSPR